MVTENPDRFDLIISDYAMPEMTGIELYNKVCKVKQNFKFIVVSGYKDIKIDNFCRQKKNVLFLKKPLKVAELTHKIRSLLDR